MSISDIEQQIAELQRKLLAEKTSKFGPRKSKGIFQIGSKRNPEKSFESWVGKLHKALNVGSGRVLIASHYEGWNDEKDAFNEVEIKFTPEMFNDRENREVFSDFILSVEDFYGLSSLRVSVVDSKGYIKESGTYMTKGLKDLYKRIEKVESNPTNADAKIALSEYIKNWTVDK